MRYSSRLRKLLLMAVAFGVGLVFLLTFVKGSAGGDQTAVSPVNQTLFEDSIAKLCEDFMEGSISGDLCNRLCYPDLNFTVTQLQLTPRVNAILKWSENRLTLRSDWLEFNRTAELQRYIRGSEEEFLRHLVDLVNSQISLSFPLRRAKLLLEFLWPPYQRTGRLSKSDRLSIMSLVSQNEFLVFTLLRPANVFPLVMGSCGHFYATEYIIPFKLNAYSYPYANLRAQILLHLGGTMKLLNNFINEPLQWCDVSFSNLGLSPDYPKRFLVTGGDQIYTESRMTEIFTNTPCQSDLDCRLGDCTARCDATNRRCAQRLNDNIEVFCKKLIKELYGDFWVAANKILAVCHFIDTYNQTKRIEEMQSFWVWSISEL